MFCWSKAPITGTLAGGARQGKRMSRYSQSVVEKILDLAQPVIDEMAFELVDVAFASERGRWVLRVYIDKEGGITLRYEFIDVVINGEYKGVYALEEAFTKLPV